MAKLFEPLQLAASEPKPQIACLERRIALRRLTSLFAGAALVGCGGGGGGGTTPSASGATASSADTASTGKTSTTSTGSAATAPAAASPAAAPATGATSTASAKPTSEPAASETANAAAAPATAAAPTFSLGVFSGGFNPTAAEAYQKWLGKDTAFNVDFLTTANTPWDLSMWAPLLKADPGHNMLFSIPLDNLAQDAAGSSDATFKAMAQAIAAIYPKAFIRIGWEMNGDWYAWSAAGKEALYIAAFNRAAAIFKSVSKTFQVDWCPNNGVSSFVDPVLCYPGDLHVDSIGMDTYMDYRYGSGDSTSRFGWLVNNGRGLAWQVAFAKEHGKLLSVPEWGVNSDDPTFISSMHAWLTTNDYAHASYWDSNSNFQGSLSDGQYPKAAAEFKKLFGA